MRRFFATTWATSVVLTLTVALLVSGALTASGDAADPGRPTVTTTERAVARHAFDVAERVLEGRTRAADPSATLALRDLWLSLPALDATERRRAEALLARPTDGAADPFGFGYTVPATKKCARNVCLHWVTSTADAPPSKRWVKTNLRQMQRVWRLQTGRLGYRKPLADGRRGGNKKFDVYLKDIGGFGLYGYCAAETRIQRFLASGYCVLDNDFSASQFPSSPKKSLKVTAAHEFFHAVQYSYDAEDDRWLMEATATWMEERLADGANDNRQYLPYGQVKDPAAPLDSYGGGALNQYGNWAFFEYLSKKYGTKIVRQIWEKMAADKKSPDLYSTQAVVRILKSRGGFERLFAEYAAGNTIPGKTYPEGGKWPSAAIAGSVTLGKKARRSGPMGTTLRHLSSSNYVMRPDSSLRSRRWQLTLRIRGPQRKTSPTAYVLVDQRRGGVERRLVKLSRKGNAKVKLGFSSRKVKKVTITLANASARFACFRQTSWSCHGNPRDDDLSFTVSGVAHK
jgi:Family of unknown function (DUF6055)